VVHIVQKSSESPNGIYTILTYLRRSSIIGVPAIGGNPQKTWTPSPVYSQDELNTHHRPSDFQKAILGMTPFSPAYSSSAQSPHSFNATVDKVEPAWITRGIRNRNQKARVLLYDHGYPQDDDTLKKLANKLLENMQSCVASRYVEFPS
jgi:hypothetical protein